MNMRFLYWSKVPLYATVTVLGVKFMLAPYSSDIMRTMGLMMTLFAIRAIQ